MTVWHGMRVARSRFGQYLYDRRRELGYTQETLGNLIGRNQRFVGQMENARTDDYIPPADVIRPLADALHTTVDHLLELAGYLDPEPQDHSPRALTMLSKIEDLTDGEQTAVEALIDALRSQQARS